MYEHYDTDFEGLGKTVVEIKVILTRMERCLIEQGDWINGTMDQEGAKVRLDRLERELKTSKWLIAIFAIPIAGGLVKYLLDVL